jgi:glutathione S-transferase
MRLFDFERAPNPRRVRIFLAEKGIDVPRVPVNLFQMEQLSPEFLAINPGGTVPVLETDEGICISECIAICRYLESRFPAPPLFGSNPTTEALALMWNNIIECEGLPAVAESLRNLSPGFKGHVLPGPVAFEQIPELVTRGRRRAEQFFQRMEQRLDSHEYLAGDEFTVADIAALVTVDFAGWIELNALAAGPAITRWYQKVSTRPTAGA